MSMQMSTKQLQNKKGIVIYNYNSPTMNYTAMTEKCIAQCRLYCPDIPIAVIGDKVDTADINISHPCPSNIHNIQGAKVWYNLARSSVYDLTPFETTVVIDSDYMVFDNCLMSLFDSDQPVLVHKNYFNVLHCESTNLQVGTSYLPMLWATVLKFEKPDENVRQMFKSWKQVIKNYRYYAVMWRLNRKMIRNDHALTIALAQTLNFGPNDHCVIPYDIVTCPQDMIVEEINTDHIVMKDQHGVCKITQSCHILNKESLVEAITG